MPSPSCPAAKPSFSGKPMKSLAHVAGLCALAVSAFVGLFAVRLGWPASTTAGIWGRDIAGPLVAAAESGSPAEAFAFAIVAVATLGTIAAYLRQPTQTARTSMAVGVIAWFATGLVWVFRFA